MKPQLANDIPPRFYCPLALEPGSKVDLPSGSAHHAARVLRLKPGDPVVLFTGQGGEYRAWIAKIGKSGVIVQIGPWSETEREAPLKISLAQALPGGEKMDFILQKAVELGISAIQPLECKRSVVRLSGERAKKKAEHWRNVVIAACEQCGRNRLPPVFPILQLAKWLEHSGLSLELRIVLSPGAKVGLRDMTRPNAKVTLLVGPEGGFAPEEQRAAETAGFLPVSFGPRILRTETAALAALAAMQALWGDF